MTRNCADINMLEMLNRVAKCLQYKIIKGLPHFKVKKYFVYGFFVKFASKRSWILISSLGLQIFLKDNIGHERRVSTFATWIILASVLENENESALTVGKMFLRPQDLINNMLPSHSSQN